jgi:RNA recognition motif-containing protein
VAKRIYVGNLPYSVRDEDLAALFANYGEVSEATVITDRDSGQSKGFGFVQMPVDSEALNAIAQLNGSMLGNRALRVNEAQPRSDRSGGGRSYGGSYGGSYGRDSYGSGRGGYRDDYRGDGGRGYEAGPNYGGRGGRQSRDRGW